VVCFADTMYNRKAELVRRVSELRSYRTSGPDWLKAEVLVILTLKYWYNSHLLYGYSGFGLRRPMKWIILFHFYHGAKRKSPLFVCDYH